VLVGLTLVIGMFGTGSPMTQLIPSAKWRQIITGFVFGSLGASIALSWVGKESGAHINPAVTMIFWLFHKLDLRTAMIYVVGQLAGAVTGSLPLLAFRAAIIGLPIPSRTKHQHINMNL
jgi:aquaporin Z